MPFNNTDRIINYHNTFPTYSKLILNRDIIEGIWVMGNNYTTKTNLYGAYPYGYLERIFSLFPLVPKKTLHLFSGSLPDSEEYGCCMARRNVVFKQAFNVLKKGGHLIWLDQVLPNYRKDQFKILGRIGMVKSTNHRFRVVTIFEKI